MVPYKVMSKDKSGSVAVMEAECVPGFCTELTVKGCKIPYELRPIQCTAYFCTKTIDELSNQECDKGIKALAGLMRIEMQMVMLAIRSRFSAK